MQKIAGILFEPVGCLAEFPAEPFLEIAGQLFHRPHKPSASGSRAYWHLLNLIEGSQAEVPKHVEALEIKAAESASLYEDVLPALTELRGMGVVVCIASSLSRAAIDCFLSKHSLGELFFSVSSRDSARGVKTTPLLHAIENAQLARPQTMFLTDTAVGLSVAQGIGVSSILMMNDPDEARRLTAHKPTGGIVSLHELPDFVRLVAAENARSA